MNIKAVIMAGGKGTRIASLGEEVPKPMIKIGGMPVLERQIRVLASQRITEIILVIGYKWDVIYHYFEDGSRWGVHIEYVVEKEPLGTAGAFYYLKSDFMNRNDSSDFLLINGDLVFDINVERFLDFHSQKKAMATIFTHPNNHPWDSALISADEDACVREWYSAGDFCGWYHNRVNAGIHLISGSIFEWMSKQGMLDVPVKINLDRQVLSKLIPEKKLFAYDSPEYVKDMGTPDRFQIIAGEVAAGKVQAKNLSHFQKAVFLDRDGTINRYVGFLKDIDDFELLPGTSQAIRKLNETGVLVIVVTNQPVIARGELTVDGLTEIHKKMETLLGKQGAYIDDIYYCPHHPNAGFAGEVSELKVKCGCRKPEPGMLLAAAEKYHIDLSESWMVGDSEIDMEAGRRAGCKCVGVGGIQGKDGTFKDLLSFCEYLYREYSINEK